MAEDYSIYSGERKTLGVVDYVLFVLMFVASAAIGFYHAYKDRNSTSVDNFHLSGRKMHPVPVCMSLVATFLSGITLLGNPSEIYTNGTMFYWIVVAMLIATISSAHVFLPVFYKLDTTSIYHYIQIRFGKLPKYIVCAIFIIQTQVYMGFVLYAPSLAFEAVTGLSLWATMIGAAFVCTLYTTLGGMKTVLWTDSLQLVIMISGLICVLVEACIQTGGIANAWNIAEEKGRIEFLNISPDPRTRHTVWSMSIGGALFWTYLYGVNQAQVQRACSLPSLKKAQLALWMNFPGLVLIITLTCLIGVVMVAFYKDCDPVKFGLVEKPDQMMPLMVLDLLSKYPGLTGLFVACIFSGGLSSMSSGLNAMSAVIVEDFVKPICCINMSGKKEVIVSKIFVIAMGAIQLGVAFAISQGSGIIIQFSYSLFSIMSGPLLGVFISGIVFPWTNNNGATTGLVIALGMSFWLAFGTILTKTASFKTVLSVSTSGCPWPVPDDNITSTASLTTVTFSGNTTALAPTDSEEEESVLTNFYRMSYIWYTGFGMMIQLIVALVVSCITGPTGPKDVDSRLMTPLFYNLCPWLPEKYRKYLKFGVDYKYDDGAATNAVDLSGFDNIAYSKNSLAK